MSELGAPQTPDSEAQAATPQANPLAAPTGAPGAAQQGFAGAFAASHSGLAARYEKIKELEGRISVAREAMDELASLHDTVTQEDVVKAASRVVGAGGDPVAMASMLAEMPEGGAALQGWVQQKDQGLRQWEARLDAEKKAARYQLGVSALQHISAAQVAHQMGLGGQPPGQQAAPEPLTPAPGGNKLTGGAP